MSLNLRAMKQLNLRNNGLAVLQGTQKALSSHFCLSLCSSVSLLSLAAFLLAATPVENGWYLPLPSNSCLLQTSGPMGKRSPACCGAKNCFLYSQGTDYQAGLGTQSMGPEDVGME